MNATPSLKGLPLLVMVLGWLTVIAGTALLFATGAPVGRAAVVAGGLAQFAGWVLHRRKLRGAA
ncbi:hypothetical protein [Streptomyces fructofermentans]|uniref:hypothetical protein n=1 Tax=Streptomyces fructofermentans TaxID=152141 RepID=UPI003799C985